MMAFHGAAAASQHAILAAAASVPYYQPVVPAQDVQPDRPIGYGAFGVVWYVLLYPDHPKHGRSQSAHPLSELHLSICKTAVFGLCIFLQKSTKMSLSFIHIWHSDTTYSL